MNAWKLLLFQSYLYDVKTVFYKCGFGNSHNKIMFPSAVQQMSLYNYNVYAHYFCAGGNAFTQNMESGKHK
jgi:hypothetical protein